MSAWDGSGTTPNKPQETARAIDADAILNEVIAREGGFVNDPADRGGPTKYGITQATLASWRGRPVTVQEVRDLDRREALAIYRRRYVIDPAFNILPVWQQPAVIDWGVNAGPAQAWKTWQETRNTLFPGAKPLVVDGILGPKTRAAVAETFAATDVERQRWLAAYTAHRLMRYLEIIRRDHTQARFAGGWGKRAMEVMHATWA